MSTAVIEREKTEVPVEVLTDYLSSFGLAASLTKEEQKQFIQIASAYQLNPFKREVYCLPYETSVKNPDGSWGKKRLLSVITGYEVYLKRAERIGALDGWEVAIEGSGDDMRAILTVYRKDWKHPFKHEVYFGEVAKKDKDGKPMSMWRTMPKFMLKKVAIAQGFRLAFPDEMGGMPYTSDELPDNMTGAVHGTGTAADPEVIPPPAPAAEQSAPSEEPRKTKPGAPVILTEGEEIPKAYWSLNTEDRKGVMPEGCKSEKVNGVWVCVRM